MQPTRSFIRLALAALLSSAAAAAPAQEHHHHPAPDPASDPGAAADQAMQGLSIPDVRVQTQDGETVRFWSDLVRDRRVAMNFVFTSCTTICPPMGAHFARLQSLLEESAAGDVELISVSVDPATDSPERLKAWGERFGAEPGWTLVTGAKVEIDRLLKSLGVFTPDFSQHTPIVLVGNEPAGAWQRVYGLTPPQRIAELLETLGGEAVPAAQAEEDDPLGARKYFTDVVLTNQFGEGMRLYSDLLEGRKVVISAFFTSCTGVCPVIGGKLAALQQHFGERLGEEVVLLSLTVDPETDTPETMQRYAEGFAARPGWYFLGGEKDNVELALRKLGMATANREAHTNLLILGDERKGSWQKVFGLAPLPQLVETVDQFFAGE